MFGPLIEELPDPGELVHELLRLPALSTVTHTAAPPFDVDRGRFTCQQELHHLCVDHVVSEPFVRALDVKSTTEFGRLEVDVIKADRPRELVEESFAPDEQVRNTCKRQMHNEVAEPVGRGDGRLAGVSGDLVCEVTHLGRARSPQDLQFAGERVVGGAAVPAPKDPEVGILLIVIWIFGGIKYPAEPPGQGGQSPAPLLFGQPRQVGNEADQSDSPDNQDKNQKIMHGSRNEECTVRTL